jgi:hypothetical protein
MGQISKKLRSSSDGSLFYWCQGCEEVHRVQVGSGPGPRWGYNGNPEAPTFSPSVLVTWDGKIDGQPVRTVCHTFINDGQVQFLGDCTHALAGQTLPLPDLPTALQDGGNYGWPD